MKVLPAIMIITPVRHHLPSTRGTVHRGIVAMSMVLLVAMTMVGCSDNSVDESTDATETGDTEAEAPQEEDGDDDEPTTDESTQANETAAGEGEVQRQPSSANSYFAIQEVGVGDISYVSLTNFTDVSVTTAGLILVLDGENIELPDVAVEAGATGRIALGDGAGLENVIMTAEDLGPLRPAEGEIALYTADDFSDPAAMINYFEWGSTPHERTDVAIEAGLWLEGSYAPTSPTATRLYRVEETGLWLFEPNN